MQDSFLKGNISKPLLAVNFVLAGVYFLAIAFLFPISSPVLFWLLIFTEVYHLWIAFGFWYTIWGVKDRVMPSSPYPFFPNVDVFITVCGEPVEIVAETVRAARALDYPHFKVYVLNDGYVAKKENWKQIQDMAESLGVMCITRTIPGGAKAGNVNNALRLTQGELFVLFDADHVPHADFLKKTVPYFLDPRTAFVQSPQYYKNHDLNYITTSAWEQQVIFFGPIAKGKDNMGGMFMCGTNMLLRKEAIMEVGGLNEETITEDCITSIFLHAKGWRSVYVPEILAEGLAPEDFLSYYKQQYRWARGSLEMIFKYNPLFIRGLTFKQRLQYLISASYYLFGLFVVLNALLPIIFFFTGLTPFTVSTMSLAAIFLPYIFLTIYTLSSATNFSYTYRAMAFSMGQFWLHLQALWSVITGRKESFAVTSKTALQGNYSKYAIPHIVYLFVTVAGASYAIFRSGLNASILTNIGWALTNCIVFIVFIIAALPESSWLGRMKIRKAPRIDVNSAVKDRIGIHHGNR